jgi:hypothetical protein
MDPVTTAAVTAIIGTVGTVLGAWAQGRAQRRSRREESRGSPGGCLPPGSKVIDLGEYKLVIEVIRVTGRELRPDDHQ